MAENTIISIGFPSSFIRAIVYLLKIKGKKRERTQCGPYEGRTRDLGVISLEGN